MEVPRPPPDDPGYALLVDAEGAASPDGVDVLVNYLRANAKVPVRRLYGSLHGQGDLGKAWENLARSLGFERRHRPRATATKNGADIALAVDAMELMGNGTRFFCIVAGDTDFGPLLEKLNGADCTTLIVSSNAALHPWSKFHTSFADLRRSNPAAKTKPIASAQTAKKGAASTPNPMIPASWNGVDDLLAGAIRLATETGHADNEAWVEAELAGSLFKKVDKSYTRKKYGLGTSTSVRRMAAAYPDRFETTERRGTNGPKTLVRLRK